MADAVTDVVALLRTRSYLVLLVLAGVLGAPIAAAAYWYLYLIGQLQKWLFQPNYLLQALGFHGEPVWWPVPLVGLAGVLVGLAIHYLPGRGGHSPADGFQMTGPPLTADSCRASPWPRLAGLALGAVIGPRRPSSPSEAGLAAVAVRLSKQDAPQQAVTRDRRRPAASRPSRPCFGSPLVGAFLLMEASGLGGPTLGVVLVPGLLAAGIGALIFIGLRHLTGYGTFSLAVPNLPPFRHPDRRRVGLGDRHRRWPPPSWARPSAGWHCS